MQAHGLLRPWVLGLLAWLTAPGIGPHPAAGQPAPLNFDAIPVWAGTGTNRAAVVIQWNDGKSPSSLVWGFRWNGTATGIDMLRAVAGASEIRSPAGALLSSTNGSDSRLSTVWTAYSFGHALLAVNWNSGGSLRGQDDWNAGFWQYSFFGGRLEYDQYDENWQWIGSATYDQPGSSLAPGNQWFLSPVGAGDRELVNGSWDAWNFVAAGSAPPLAEPVPAPARLTVPAPRVHATRIPGPGLLEISFTTQAGASYQLKKNTSPVAGTNWTAVGPAVTATSTVTPHTIPMNHPGGREFFRLETVP